MIIKPIRKIITNRKIPKPRKESFEGLSVRPNKKNTRLFIDNEYFEKGYAEVFPKSVLAVYCILAKYANYETQTCFPSIDTIMRESGIRRRNTVINALKILELYNVIHINHSKGWCPNQYALLDARYWKEPNSIGIDPVNGIASDTENSIKIDTKQYQKQSLNSITSDTGNHLIKLSNEIMDQIKNSPNKETNIEAHLSKLSFSVLKYHYQEKDILQAVSSLKEAGKEISFYSVKDLLNLWSKDGKIIPIKEIKW
jgi:hypothetical protein